MSEQQQLLLRGCCCSLGNRTEANPMGSVEDPIELLHDLPVLSCSGHPAKQHLLAPREPASQHSCNPRPHLLETFWANWGDQPGSVLAVPPQRIP